MGPWLIATLGLVALAGLVVVVRLTRNPGTRAAPRRAAEAIPDIRGSMSLAAERYPFTVAVEAAHEDPWAGLPDWAPPKAHRDDSYGWVSGPGTAWQDGGGWDFHEWDPWNPDPHERLADTGDVMDARLAADVAAELHRQDADVLAWLALRAGQWQELAGSR